MNYIVYDTEFSQPQPKLYNINARFKPNPISPFEIIEIGAVKVNENLEITDTFSRLIKPAIYKRLSPIVVKKTGITKKHLETADNFRKVMKQFRNWLGEDYILCAWSNNDIRVLRNNCMYHKMDCRWLEDHYDLQKCTTQVLGFPKHQAVGLKNALEAFDIEIDGRFHRALEDALHTAKVFVKVMENHEGVLLDSHVK